MAPRKTRTDDETTDQDPLEGADAPAGYRTQDTVDKPKVSGNSEGSVPFTSPEEEANGAATERGLSNEQIVLRRTSGNDWPLDGRYRRVFNVEIPRSSTGELPDVDWSDDQHDAMHEANKVATLQEALNKGLHPRAEATYDGPDGEPVLDSFRQSGRQGLVYSVEVVPASVEAPEDAALAYTPSAALVDLGGTTLPDQPDGE